MFKKTVAAIIIVVIIVAASWYFYHLLNIKKPMEFFVVQKGVIVQEVSVTGRIKPAEKVELGFEKTGKIIFAGAPVGTKIYAGALLAQIDSSDLRAQLAQAEAEVKSQEAQLAELAAGTRPEEIQVQEAKVSKDEISLADVKKNAVDALSGGYTKADDAVRNKIDQFFSNPRSQKPELTFAIADGQLESDIEWGRVIVEQGLINMKNSIDALSLSSDLKKEISGALENMAQIKSLVDKTALAVNGLKTSSALSQTTIDAYRTDVYSARTNVNTAVTNLLAAEEDIKTAEAALVISRNELALKKAGSTKEQMETQKAKIEQARASVENYKAQIAKTSLASPINGVIAKQEAKVGEIVSAGAIVVSIISESRFEIEANIPEADIAKVAIGNQADIKLDAYGNDVVLKAKVTQIEPSETILDGVATYKTALVFDKDDARVKAGMTVDVVIATKRLENAVSVLQRLIFGENGNKFVNILDGESLKKTEIKTGIRGSLGEVEVLSGLKEGDKVAAYEKK